MDASLTVEQEELRAQARAFLDATPEPTWLQLAALGWTGVTVPEEHGGAGLGFLEQAMLHEELGRALTPGPFYATIAVALPALPPDDQALVASGETSWALALGPLVPNLDTVTHVAVAGGDGLYELEGFERELLSTHDETRPLGVVVGGAVGRRLSSTDVLPEIRRRSLTALALEACGVGARALELTVAYVAEREQFGRPVGSYQAVAHPLATTYTELELGRSLALGAAWAVSVGDGRAGALAAAAKAHAADAAVAACERSIQAHGGIGFTWEHPLQRLYKRALGIRAWEASTTTLRSEIATRLLDEGGW